MKSQNEMKPENQQQYMLLLGIPQQRLAAGFPASLHILNSICGVSENALEGLSARLVLSFSKKRACFPEMTSRDMTLVLCIVVS